MPNSGRMRSTFTIFSNGSIPVIPPGFKFMELHTLTLAGHSYALLCELKEVVHISQLQQLELGVISVL